MAEISIKEVAIEETVKANARIPEFDAYDSNYFLGRIKDKEQLILVAYVGLDIAGYLIAYDRDNDGSFYCWMAGVLPPYRRLGILGKLIRYQNKWAKDRGYSKIRIKTRNNRREMLGFLVKNEFLAIEVIPYESPRENRILFEKDIN